VPPESRITDKGMEANKVLKKKRKWALNWALFQNRGVLKL